MRTWMRTLTSGAARAWAWLRAVSGDDAYESYMSRAARPGPPPTREEFYVDQLRRRYSRPRGCC
jgi:uncharacterized short protein YbdD (DUF466 family)